MAKTSVISSEMYDCPGVGAIEVAPKGNESLTLRVDDQEYALAQIHSASGARYEGAGAGFWSKGDEAMLELGERRLNCRREPAKSG